MLKSKSVSTPDGQIVHILHSEDYASLEGVLMENRHITDPGFFSPALSDLHDPYLMPDMEKAVKRILEARDQYERVVIFGDYDVDGVSSTAILVRYFREIGIEVSYRLPHRVHDGYGLKSYFFDDLHSKNVKLVITVDCGTRDIEPIRYAKSLGIDVIVTDHHAVPEIIPEEVVALLNPKRKDSLYPFPNLAGAGVAFKLLHAVAKKLLEYGSENEVDAPLESKIQNLESLLTRYIDLASLGTVADCMPLTGENRTITALGLRQMKQSESSALRTFLEKNETESEGNADVIGFQIGPRINAAGRMDSPLKALHWLLATEDRVDDWLLEVESLNTKRQEEVKKYTEDALMTIDASEPILFYTHDHIEHGLIGLVAGRLTEAYGKPSIVLCRQHSHEAGEPKKREYEAEILDSGLQITDSRLQDTDEENQKGAHRHSEERESRVKDQESETFVASCRSPEWCHLVELLDDCREYFVRYGGHRQAAGFTIEGSKLPDFQKAIREKFALKYDITDLPKKTLTVECILKPEDVDLTTLDLIDRFRPFGIGNMKPLFVIEGLTVREVRTLGKEGQHLSIEFVELPKVKCLIWNFEELFGSYNMSPPGPGDILSPIVSLERNTWNGKTSIQMMLKNIIL